MPSSIYPTNTKILLDTFDVKIASRWLIFGALTGVVAAISGKSIIPITVFSFVSDFGYLMFFLVIAVSALSVLGRLPGRIGQLARGDFENFERCALSKALRAAASLAGLAFMGGTYAIATGSNVGVLLCIYAGIYSLCVLWCWGCLAILSYKHYNKPPQ